MHNFNVTEVLSIVAYTLRGCSLHHNVTPISMYPSIFSWRCPLRFCVWRVRGTAPLLTKKRATATARSGADSKSQNCSNVLWSRSQRREEVEEDMCWKRLPKHQKTNQIPPDRSMYVTLERSLLFCSFKFSTFFLFFSHFWQFSSWVSDVFDFRTSFFFCFEDMIWFRGCRLF